MGKAGVHTDLMIPRSRAFPCSAAREHNGAERDRTADLLNAIQALSQLSYSPKRDPAGPLTRISVRLEPRRLVGWLHQIAYPNCQTFTYSNGTDGTRTHGLRSDSAAL